MSIPNLPNAISMELVASKENTNVLTLCQKIKYITSHITVEPLVFFYILPGMMGLLATQNMNLEKACLVNLKYDATVCDALVRRDHTGYEDYQEAEVQKLVAKMVIIKTAIIGFFPTVLLLFFGSWSDRHQRRKPVILIPIICDILSGLGLMVCAYFYLETPIELVLLFDCFPYALGGGWCCVFLGVFSYVSGLSSDEYRTIRIGTLSMFQNAAMIMGNVLGGVLIGPLGLKYAYLFALFIMGSCLIYGFIVIKDNATVTNDAVMHKSFLKDFLDTEHVKNTFKICFKEGPSNRKRKMFVIMIATMLVMGPLHGELAVLYLYTRIKFGWNEVDYSLYNTLQFVIQILGSVFALTYFSKKLKLDDATLGIIALISKISACLIYAFAPSGQYFYLGCFVEIFHGTCHIALRSLMAKIVPPHELGQSNSVFGVCEAVMPLVFGPFYAILYNYTIKILPGGFYLVSAALYTITLPLFIWLLKCSKKDQRGALQQKIQLAQEENLLTKTILSERKKSIELLKT